MSENVSEDRIVVAAICGSLRPGSYTKMALEVALEGAREQGVRTKMMDLRDYDLIFCDGKRRDSDVPEEVLRFRHDIRAAQGIILGTPEYHGSFSGVLKNALDLTGFQEFEGKMIGLVSVSGGKLGGISALTDLRATGRALHAWVVPEQAGVPEAARQFGSDGRLQDEALESRVKEVGRQVAKFACLHGSEQWRDFLDLWQQAPRNPGGAGQ